MTKPFITSVAEEDKEKYSKLTGDAKGTDSLDVASFKEKMLEQIVAIKDGSFLSGKFSKLNLKVLDLIAKGKGLLNIGKLKDSLLKNIEGKLPLSLKSLGLKSLVSLITIAEKVFGKLIEQITASLMSKIFIPDPVYLASLIAFDIAGADLEMHGNYIRKLILKRDITMALKWWNKTWEITYSGLRSDPYTNDAFAAAKSGSFKNVVYILEEFNKSYYSTFNAAKLHPIINKSRAQMTPEELKSYNTRNLLLNAANETFELMVYIVKELIVYGYSNFTADELKSILKKFNISPSYFGVSDVRFGGRYAIKSGNIEIMAPFFKFEELSPTLNKLENNRSSRNRRKEYKRLKGNVNAVIEQNNSRISEALTYIHPRNKNVKRLYLTLISNEFDSPMYNPQLAERLGYKIANMFVKAIDIDISGLIPNSVFKTQEKVWSSAYDYTKEIEDYLFDPAKSSDLILKDNTVIRMPADVQKTISLTNTNTTSSTTTTSTSSNEVNSNNPIIVNNIGPVLLIDSINIDISLGGSLPISINVYMKKLVDQFVSLDVEDLVKSVINKVSTGEIVLRSDDSIERLAFYNYKSSGGLSFNEINADQIISILIDRMKNGVYDKEFLKNNTMMDIITRLANELKANDTFIRVLNNPSEENITKLLISNVKNLSEGIVSGRIDPSTINSYDSLKLQAVIDNSNGVVASTGKLSKELYFAINVLNERLADLHREKITEVSISDLLQNKSFTSIVEELRNNNSKLEIEIDAIREELLRRITEMLSKMNNGIIPQNSFPTFNEIYNISLIEIENKYNITDVLDILKAFGLDVAGDDIMEYYRGLDKKINGNKDEELFEFDINNPPPKVLMSLDEEYADREKFKFKYYKWVEQL